MPEKVQRRGAFFRGPANVVATAESVREVVEAIGEREPGIGIWASLGFCWGGKVSWVSFRFWGGF